MRLKDHAIKPCSCPACGKVLDRSLEIQAGRGPKPGDISICIGCGAVAFWTELLDLRAASKEELRALPFSTQVLIDDARAAMQAMRDRGQGLR